ncbi:hypothetical protein TEA_015964 [Camellia sinensis var. sinensis]|uniref:Uncharacterized protein n=1 Tax=Camellia sinensis var. sinensis TaxID=542762 RepID=A0A4S4F594_CAMSN|nr:hypothetical protein TEA_015964 [Camellia sinensis var. sinensis]
MPTPTMLTKAIVSGKKATSYVPLPMSLHLQASVVAVLLSATSPVLLQVLCTTCYPPLLDADLDELRQSEGRHAQLLSTMCKCYRDWHVESLGVYDGIQATHGQEPVSVAWTVNVDEVLDYIKKLLMEP